ncbi:MAG: hypothetical protein MUP71_12565 [Candidatus Aminicenantes bacterium]|nr:hypothetical protein [Candidatus Aminicenantes bacterium]
MDEKKFREIEDLYKDLKERQASGEISGDDMKAELKKMMIRDEESRYWMLGSKTGDWYVYDGSTWKAARPYGHEETPLLLQPELTQVEKIPVADREVQRPAEDKSESFCKFCHSRMDEHDAYCKFCGASQKAAARALERHPGQGEMLVRSVRIFSLIFFFGGLGLVAGVIFGATFGIFKIFGDLIFQFPLMLQEMHGKIHGGLFFGAIGGIAGFIGCALLAVLFGLLYNAMAFVFGGLRFKVKS